MSSPTPIYRREIDGLRAIAVLAVVLYHFGIPGLDGGFVGVDVFFVISGFLIGAILWREHQTTGRLSLGRFYLRRIRRLAPAFVAVAVVSSMFAWVILLPFEFREFGKMLIAATFYFSNILFFRQTGYFDTASEEKVLLHTWSLSVEEQFYIFLPLLTLLFARSKHTLIGVLILAWAASLVANIALTPVMQTATFYLFPFRAWELLTGVLLAIWGYERVENWVHHQALSWIGVALILGSVVLVQPGPGFPGFQVVAPVLGTALVLLNGRQDNFVNAALSSRGFVFFGLISYSLYLWHWPVLVLSKYWRDGYSSASEVAFWLLVAMVLGTLSWRFVERPTRHSMAPARIIFGTAIIASLSLSVFGFLIYQNQGLPQRFSAKAQVHIAASADFLQDFSRCSVASDGVFAGQNICELGPAGQKPSVIVWGDSHLRAFAEGIAAAADAAGTSGLLIWNAGCPPLFGLTKTETYATPSEDTACNGFNAEMPSRLAQLSGIDRILLVGRWSYYASGRGVGLDAENGISLVATSGETAPQDVLFADAVSTTVSALSRDFSQVFVLRQVPEIPTYDSRQFARKLAHGQSTGLASVSQGAALERAATGAAPFDRAAASGNVKILDPWPRLCADGICPAVQNGRGLYFDNNHLTNTGARLLTPLFAPVFDGASK